MYNIKEFFEKIFLADNPFSETPPTVRFVEIWASREELKTEIEQQILFSLQTSPSKIVLNWGDIGTGKTHATKYFSNPAVIEKLSKDSKISISPLVLSIGLPEPEKPREALGQLYIDFLNEIGFDRLKDGISKVYNQLEISGNGLYEFGLSKDLATIFKKLAATSEEIMTEDFDVLIQRYFYRNAKPTELRDLEVVKGIDSARDILKTLSAIINFLTTDRVSKPAYSKIFIWIDECEKMSSYSGSDIAMFRGFLRDIVDYAPNNLTIFLNYTLLPGEKFEDVPGTLGYMVWDRVGKSIYFPTMEEKEAFNYVIKLMNDIKYRPKELQRKTPDEYYPFTKGALGMIIKNTRVTSLKETLTPRAINKKFTEILEAAGFSGKITKISDRIDEHFIKENEKRFFPSKVGEKSS